MRTDMKKVLTERPRRNNTESYKNVRRRENSGDYDDLPSHRGIRRPYRDPKEFSDLIGPLIHFLEGRVGRKWDDVWSEICAVLSPSSHMDNHLLLHVEMAVERHTFVVDGEVWALGRYCGRRKPWGLYVDPRDGILYKPVPEPRPVFREVVIDGLRYRYGNGGILYRLSRYRERSALYPMKLIGRDKAMLIDGVWYWIEMAETPPPYDAQYYKDGKLMTRRVYSPRHDFVLGESVQEGRYHAGKRQMCSRDLRKNGLRNTI